MPHFDFQIESRRKRRIDVEAAVDTDLTMADVTINIRLQRLSDVVVITNPTVTDIEGGGINIAYTLTPSHTDIPAGLYRVEIIDTTEDRSIGVGQLEIDEKSVEVPAP
jgi:hypothetical protein